MPWKARQVLLARDGTIYAHRGKVLPDDDPIALANPTSVVSVSDPAELTVQVHEVEVQQEETGIHRIPVPEPEEAEDDLGYEI